MSNDESSTDRVAKAIFVSLLRDFRSLHGNDFARGAELAFRAGIKEFRDYVWPTLGNVGAYRHKAWHQLSNLCKRHRFVGDKYTASELEQRTNESYIEAQNEFAVYRPLSLKCTKVTQEARRICRKILGNFDEDALAAHFHFGARSSLGNPLESAFLDVKLSDPKALTCPTALRRWFFKHYLHSDSLLKEIIRKVFKTSRQSGVLPDLSADTLNLVQVPKSWKINRAITPLSLIGLFFSYGVGGAVEDRLAANRMDIVSLQQRHRMLAKRYSKTRTHVTADLQRASDSLRSDLLNRVLPRAWYRALRCTFIRQMLIGKTKLLTESVLPMGNGATFPVETLVFYSLIKAVGNLLKVGGVYSVYGDDLIYPRSIHPYVCQIFGELGIKINEDKTFVNSYFRESCGGDYFQGCDVRPALLPENKSPNPVGNRYRQHLYKVYNTLLRRWEPEEIPTTLRWLELELAPQQIFQVPMFFPDTSGIKCIHPRKRDWWTNYATPRAIFQDGTVSIRFRYLGTSKGPSRPIVTESPYYWDSLRQMTQRRPPGWRFWDTYLVEVPDGELVETLKVSYSDVLKKRVTYGPDRIEGQIKGQEGLVSNWTQDA